jgi:hypothetical protein
MRVLKVKAEFIELVRGIKWSCRARECGRHKAGNHLNPIWKGDADSITASDTSRIELEHELVDIRTKLIVRQRRPTSGNDNCRVRTLSDVKKVSNIHCFGWGPTFAAEPPTNRKHGSHKFVLESKKDHKKTHPTMLI